MAKTQNGFPVVQTLEPSLADSTQDMDSINKNPDNLNKLLAVIQKLSLAKDLETIMFIVRKAARELSGADGATFVLRDGDQCFYADEDAIAPLWKGKRFPLNACISGWVMEHCKATVIEDIYEDPRIPVDAYRPTFVKSLAMTPIRTLNPIGAIGTYWADHYKPTEEQLSLLRALADSTSIAMENIQLQSEINRGTQETSAQVEITRKLMKTNCNLEFALNELHHRNEEMHLLKEFSSGLQISSSLNEAYSLIARYVFKMLPNTSGIIYLMHPSRNYLEAMVSWGDMIEAEKIIKLEDCLALRRGSTYHVDNYKNNLVCKHYIENPKREAYTCIPLFAQSDIIGLFYFEWNNVKNNDFTEIDPNANQDILTTMIAEQIAIGISNIKLRETLRNFSTHDTLTGLYNRRYLEEGLDRELSRCERKSLSLALFMIDIDHFKQFNDKFGHEAGDIVMQSLASVLRNFARKDDIACRFGGEEFIFVLPEMDLETAIKRADALHEAVGHIYLRYGGMPLTQITISIGIAMFPGDGKNLQKLILAADTALYQAKNSGRNKTVVYKKEE